LLRAPTILVLLFSSEPPLIALLRAWTPFVLIPLSLAPQVVLFYFIEILNLNLEIGEMCSKDKSF
jgi:hypothetical protein